MEFATSYHEVFLDTGVGDISHRNTLFLYGKISVPFFFFSWDNISVRSKSQLGPLAIEAKQEWCQREKSNKKASFRVA